MLRDTPLLGGGPVGPRYGVGQQSDRTRNVVRFKDDSFAEFDARVLNSREKAAIREGPVVDDEVPGLDNLDRSVEFRARVEEVEAQPLPHVRNERREPPVGEPLDAPLRERVDQLVHRGVRKHKIETNLLSGAQRLGARPEDER